MNDYITLVVINQAAKGQSGLFKFKKSVIFNLV